jgi:methylthioribose-1-phosphate isomerase
VDAGLAALRGDETPREAAGALLAAARALEAYEREACDAIGRAGAAWVASTVPTGRVRLLTHCNAGALVTPGIGTALAPVYVLHHRGRDVHVWVDETRPLLQGLRLTSWELARAGVPHAVLVDGAAAGLIARGEVDAVIVGADRVCANGDVVNKVGTYGLALAARRHGVPFLVAAPESTRDVRTPTGAHVEIEERRDDPHTYLRTNTALPSVPAFAPAFDVTPADLVTLLLTERSAPTSGLQRPSPPVR